MTFQNIPANYGRVSSDTNRIYFKLYTSNYTLPNFRYVINLYIKINGAFTPVGSVRKRPSVVDGSCIFYPSEILSNYVSSDIDINITGITACYNSNIRYKIGVSEQNMTGRGMISSSEEYSTELVAFNGAQDYIPYDIEGQGGGNYQYVMRSGTTLDGTGRYLTDSLMSYVDPIEHKFLYYMTYDATGATYKPLQAVFSIYYGTNEIDEGKNMVNYSQSSPGSLSSESGKNIYDYADLSWSGDIEQKTMDLTHTGDTYMWAIPTGPIQLEQLGYFNTGKTWVKYRVDLFNSLTKYNLGSYVYYKKNKCHKYRNYEIIWRNPHGGFDSYLFHMKNNITYNIERKLYEKRLDYNYTIGDRGTTIYSVITKEVITLNSDFVTQNEYQILTQMIMSPEVYMVYYYLNNTYIVPMIVQDESIEYKYIDQEKLISMSVNMTPSFTKNYK